MPPLLSTRAHRWTAATVSRIGQDRPYYYAIVVFVALTAATANWLHRDYLIVTIQGYLELWTDLAMLTLTVLFCFTFTRRSWTEGWERPMALAKEIALVILVPKTVAGVVLYLALAIFMGAFTTFKTLLPCLNDFWADPWLAELDRLVHGGQQPWRLLQPLLGYPPITRVIEMIYGPVWISCVSLLPLFFCLSDRYPDDRRRFLVAFLLTWTFNGLFLAGLFMSGGPAFYGRLVHDNALYGDLQRYLGSEAAIPFSASWEQAQLWAIQQAGLSGVGAGISDFPSLHVSMIMLCCFSVWNISRRAAFIFVGLAAVIVIGSVHLGWHYLVGDHAVFATMAAIWRVSSFLATRMAALAASPGFDDNGSENGYSSPADAGVPATPV